MPVHRNGSQITNMPKPKPKFLSVKLDIPIEDADLLITALGQGTASWSERTPALQAYIKLCKEQAIIAAADDLDESYRQAVRRHDRREAYGL